MAAPSPLRICLITGIAGSGKSELIEHIQSVSPCTEFSVIPVDARKMAELPDDLTDLAGDGRTGYVLLEADPGLDLMRLVEMTAMVCDVNTEDGIPMKLDNVAAVIDCAAASRAFAEGRLMNRPPLSGPDLEYQTIWQLEMASTVIFNKTDLIDDVALDELIVTARFLQPDAAMVLAEHGAVPAAEILETNRFEHEHLAKSAGWVNILQNPETEAGAGETDDEDYGLGTFLYMRRQPFDHRKLVELCDCWPHSVIRMKGMVWYQEEPDMSFILEQAGRRITESPSGKFLAAAPKDDQFRVLIKHPEVRSIWDKKYGDRMIKLAFVTKRTDLELLTYRLDACLGDI